MGMFLELSRPRGDISRWEKVFSRLLLLNEYYPLKTNKQCLINGAHFANDDENINENIFNIIFDFLVKHDVVFLGGYAFHLYTEIDENENENETEKFTALDVLTDDIEAMSKDVVELFPENSVFVRKNDNIEELIPETIEIVSKLDNKILVTLYKPIACHSYNEVKLKNHKIKIASIDTILSFYLAFLYVKGEKYEKEKFICMAAILFDIEQKNHNSKNSIFKRFSIDCYGTQKTLTDIRLEKGEKYKEFNSNSKKVDKKEYDSWFLRYRPGDKKTEKKVINHNSKHKSMKNMKKKESNPREKRETNKTKKYTKKIRKTETAKLWLNRLRKHNAKKSENLF
jgi:hypothetical protein